MILKPKSPSRIWRKSRRKRPTYPAVKVGEQRLMQRDECGRNVSVPYTDAAGKRVRSVINKAFVFGREQMRPTSKYFPK